MHNFLARKIDSLFILANPGPAQFNSGAFATQLPRRISIADWIFRSNGPTMTPCIKWTVWKVGPEAHIQHSFFPTLTSTYVDIPIPHPNPRRKKPSWGWDPHLDNSLCSCGWLWAFKTWKSFSLYYNVDRLRGSSCKTRSQELQGRPRIILFFMENLLKAVCSIFVGGL